MKKIKVLIADDNQMILKMISKKLQKEGFDVLVAEDGLQALSIIEDELVDLILLDQMMPEMTGIETLEKISSKFKDPPPAIMVTAHGNTHLAVEFMKAGGADFIQKPIDFKILWIKIYRVLENRELKKQYEHEKISREAAEKANRLKSDFLSNMSHELRTPMSGIMSFAQLGIENTLNTEKTREVFHDYFIEILNSSKRLLSLLNDLLDLSKLEAGKMNYNFSTNSLFETVLLVLSGLSIIIQEQQIILDFQKPDFDDTLLFDQDRIMQIIRNLLSNAIKFSSSGNKIVLKITNNNKNIILSVKDNGIGIPEGELEEVFKKFIQSSKTNKGAGGTGLGLAISKQIILDHKGEIWAENNPEGGSVFSISIPKSL